MRSQQRILVEQHTPFSFVDLFISPNPFCSLANNIVPAVVLFSVFIGVTLIGVERKQSLLDLFAVAKDALSKLRSSSGFDAKWRKRCRREVCR